MSQKIITIVSPREPSGVTWLINCFLELGIMAFRNAPERMWARRPGGLYRLQPEEGILKKWLPALTDHQEFDFIKGVRAEWTHELPVTGVDYGQVLFFVRDPRDALFSRFQREGGGLSYQEFLDFLDPTTLLNRVDRWDYLARVWTARPGAGVYRFEDYKKDPEALLNAIVKGLGLEFASQDVSRAVEMSSFARAAAAEQRYKEEHPEDEQLINRAGGVGGWRDFDGQRKEATEKISVRLGEFLERFGYVEAFRGPENNKDYKKHLARLPLFSRRHGLEGARGGDALKKDIRQLEENVRRFGEMLNLDILSGQNFTPWERELLLVQLGSYLKNTGQDTYVDVLSGCAQDHPDKDEHLWTLFRATGNFRYLKKISPWFGLARIRDYLLRKIRRGKESGRVEP